MAIITRSRISALFAFALVLLALAAPSAGANDGYPDYPGYGTEGCTPGYWKNHLKAWVGFSTAHTVGSVFTAGPALSSQTLSAALSFRGGSTLAGAKQILLRAAVASLLNASSDIDFALSVSDVIAQTDAALASGNRAVILAQASAFDQLNNAGCPPS